jgi:hypothetical protein
MRLLNAQSLELTEFFGADIPGYSILSHTWGSEEVTFQDLARPDYQKKRGFAKIQGCREQTIKDGLKWFWVDTCCIDKSSSAELSEAINSMYIWYARSHVCYAYISDVSELGTGKSRREDSPLRGSRWFTRGWTLQELLAPRKLVFYTASWVCMGRRSDLIAIISDVTGIDASYLRMLGIKNTRSRIIGLNTGLKLSWASKRETLREEDMAYCLMGLLGVNMPLLYGEGGARAFRRLQEEVIRNRYDQTILAWGTHWSARMQPRRFNMMPFIAESVSCFKSWIDTMKLLPAQGSHFSLTNLGLLIDMPLLAISNEATLGFLDCSIDGNHIVMPLDIQRRHGAVPLAYRCWGIAPFAVPAAWRQRADPTSIYLCDNPRSSGSQYPTVTEIEAGTVADRRICVDWLSLSDAGYDVVDYYPPKHLRLHFSLTEGYIPCSGDFSLLLHFTCKSKDTKATKGAKGTGDALFLFVTDTLAPGGWPGSVPMLGGHAGLAFAPRIPCSWTLAMGPDFDGTNLERLQSSFVWDSTSRQVVNQKSPGTPLQFELAQRTNEWDRPVIGIESVGRWENNP